MPASTLRIGAKTRTALAHLLEGRATTQRQAAKLAGMSETEFSRALQKPHVQAYAIERAKLHLKGFPAIAAAARLSSLVNAKSEEVASKVATRIAEGAGILDVRDTASGASAAAGPVLTIVFKHVEIGAPSAQSPGANAQVIETTALPAPTHFLDKDAGGLGALPGAADRGEAGLKKRDAALDHHPVARVSPEKAGPENV